MATRLTFLCAGATAVGRVGGFPHPDAPLDEAGARKAAAFASPGKRWDRIVSSPSRAALETAAALGHVAEPSDAVADMDFGHWSGQTFAEIERTAPGALPAWLADPTAAPPGGENMGSVLKRVGEWMERSIDRAGATLVLTHATVLRTAIAHALAMPLRATLQIDVAPLAVLELSHNGRWRLQELRRP